MFGFLKRKKKEEVKEEIKEEPKATFRVDPMEPSVELSAKREYAFNGIILSQDELDGLNRDKQHYCDDCIYLCRIPYDRPHRCKVDNHDTQATPMHEMGYCFVNVLWNKCDGYTPIRTCENCVHYRKSSIILADKDRDVRICSVRGKCKDCSQWRARNSDEQ